MNKAAKVLLVTSIVQTMLFSNQIDKSVNIIEKNNETLNTYQKVIDKNELVREKLLNEYKYFYSSLQSTQRYNNQLEKIINSQNEELASYNQQIVDIEQTQKNIFPLMEDMIISLKTLVKEDTPFLLSERMARVTKLENSLNKADIQTHEKYRIILEAFKIEYDYAKTIETYQDKIDGKTVNILRVGRVGLYSQSLDLKEYGYFNNQTKLWETIDDSTSKSNIRKAIKIANKQQNVELLNLPFLATKEKR
ncbi:MAG: DUF3450 domain-containing protein [Arcobacteraceae bacterium]